MEPETACLVMIVIVGMLVLGTLGIHKIDEGYVGIYYQGGKLLDMYTEPGYHLKMPYTSMVQVQITIQTDMVRNIPCGTSGGVMIYFDKIEVVNALRKSSVLQTIKNYTTEYDKTWIFDKIHHEINQFCSKHTLQQVYIDEFDTLDEALVDALQRDCNKWAPGITITAIRVTKPKIPLDLLNNYEAIEREKASLMIALEKAKVVAQEVNLKRNQEITNAYSQLDVARIEVEKMLKQKQSEYEVAKITNSLYIEKEKSQADVEYYNSMKELEMEKSRLTPSYLKLLEMEELSKVKKVYFVQSLSEIEESRKSLLGIKNANKM